MATEETFQVIDSDELVGKTITHVFSDDDTLWLRFSDSSIFGVAADHDGGSDCYSWLEQYHEMPEHLETCLKLELMSIEDYRESQRLKREAAAKSKEVQDRHVFDSLKEKYGWS